MGLSFSSVSRIHWQKHHLTENGFGGGGGVVDSMLYPLFR